MLGRTPVTSPSWVQSTEGPERRVKYGWSAHILFLYFFSTWASWRSCLTHAGDGLRPVAGRACSNASPGYCHASTSQCPGRQSHLQGNGLCVQADMSPMNSSNYFLDTFSVFFHVLRETIPQLLNMIWRRLCPHGHLVDPLQRVSAHQIQIPLKYYWRRAQKERGRYRP